MKPEQDICELMLSDENRVSSGEYVNVLWRMYLGRNWWWMMLPAGVLCVFGFVHINFLVAGLFCAFVLEPMILVLIYFNYTLTEEIQWSLRPKSVKSDGARLALEFSDERGGAKVLAWSEVGDVLVSERYVAVMLRHRKYAMILFRRK